MANDKLHEARLAKNDEFYTQYSDIEKEMNAYIEYNENVFRDKTILLPCDDPEWSNFTKYFAQNFHRFGIKKLISTSFANNSKVFKKPVQLSLLETNSEEYDEVKTNSNGKIFTLTRSNKPVDINDLKWKYLKGDGDFRSDEVRKLRDEADIIITNPPFSLFREFLNWIMEANKQFIIIGNLNCIKYSEVFPYLMENKIWMGATCFTGGATYFIGSPELYDENKMSNPKHAYIRNNKLYWRVNGVRWFCNIDHGKRHSKIELMTAEDNIKFNSKLTKKLKEDYGVENYPKYDDYDALEVPYADSIPLDYKGVMAVPISFMDKYCPEQFEIVGEFNHGSDNDFDLAKPSINGKELYPRIAIKFK